MRETGSRLAHVRVTPFSTRLGLIRLDSRYGDGGKQDRRNLACGAVLLIPS